MFKQIVNGLDLLPTVLYTVYLYTVCFILYTVYCILCIEFPILCIVHCILYIAYSILYTVYCISVPYLKLGQAQNTECVLSKAWFGTEKYSAQN